MFKWLKALFTPVTAAEVREKLNSLHPEQPKSYVTIDRNSVKVDLAGFFASPEGKQSLQDVVDLTNRLIASGHIIDRSK